MQQEIIVGMSRANFDTNDTKVILKNFPLVSLETLDIYRFFIILILMILKK